MSANSYKITGTNGIDLIGNTTISGSITTTTGITIPSGYTLDGTASFATTAISASTIKIGTNDTFYPIFVDSTNSSPTGEPLYTDNGASSAFLTYNPFKGELTAKTFTGTASNAATASFLPVATYNITASQALTASFALNAGTSINTSSLATTGSNQFNGNQTITGSLTISQNLTVLGSSSITYISQSTLDIGTNLITVNAAASSTRFGGLAVIDSGSSPQRSGSILFDSQNNQWIFIHQNPAGAVTSSVFIQGPQTFGNVGNETTLTTNRIPKATGGDLGEHIGDSNITDTGTAVSINSNSSVTGSFTVISGGVIELQVTSSGVNIGNLITDVHNVTGSMKVSGSITGSLFGTASYALASAGGGGSTFAVSIGNGSATNIGVTHNLNTRDILVQVYDNNTYETVLCDIVRTDVNFVTCSFTIAPSSNQYRVVIKS